jgi:predicted RNase H-related nuclease YkuK (DUF458 family)
MEFNFIGDIIAGAILFIVTGLSAYIFKYFKDKKKEIEKNQLDIEKLCDKVEELNRRCKYDAALMRKAIVILSKRLDKKNKEIHPDIDTAFEEVTKDILTDDY